ncbi:Peptide chain release factor APG3 chloroplastic [Bienertia sinuspersici]
MSEKYTHGITKKIYTHIWQNETTSKRLNSFPLAFLTPSTYKYRVHTSGRYEIKVREQQEQIRNQRKSQVGTGSRSEKIRTYNYKVDAPLIIRFEFLQDNRVTDHRLKMNFELTSFLEGNLESAVQVLHLLTGSIIYTFYFLFSL